MAGSSIGAVGVTTEAVIPSRNDLDTPGSGDVAPLPPDDYYTPTPLCETEEVIGEVLEEQLIVSCEGLMMQLNLLLMRFQILLVEHLQRDLVKQM